MTDTLDPRAIGGRIRAARKAIPLKQAALARRLGVDQGTVAHWECGRNLPSVACLCPLAEALGVSVVWLLKGAD